MFLGLRTVIYPAPDLPAATAWWRGVLGIDPYFEEPFFVGFSVGGYELGLDPQGRAGDPPRTYWGVPDAEAALAQLEAAGATVSEALTDVGDGIRLGVVVAPTGWAVGIIENPHFEAAPRPAGAEGPGR